MSIHPSGHRRRLGGVFHPVGLPTFCGDAAPGDAAQHDGLGSVLGVTK